MVTQLTLPSSFITPPHRSLRFPSTLVEQDCQQKLQIIHENYVLITLQLSQFTIKTTALAAIHYTHVAQFLPCSTATAGTHIKYNFRTPAALGSRNQRHHHPNSPLTAFRQCMTHFMITSGIIIPIDK